MIDRVEILGFGIIKKSIDGNFDEESSSSPTGYFKRTDDVEIVSQTQEIDVGIGDAFGIKYKLISDSSKGIVEFQCNILHPKLSNPETGRVYSETVEDKSNYLNEENFDFYEFEEHWELQSGTWIFQIVSNDTVLLEQEFHVSSSV